VKVQTNPQQASVQPDLLVHGADGVVDGAQVLDGLGTAVSGVGDHGHDPAPVGPQCLAERGEVVAEVGGVDLDDLAAAADPGQGALDAVVADASRHDHPELFRVGDATGHAARCFVLAGQHHGYGVAGGATAGDDAPDVPHARHVGYRKVRVADHLAQPPQDGDLDERGARGVEALVNEVLLGEQPQQPAGQCGRVVAGVAEAEEVRTVLVLAQRQHRVQDVLDDVGQRGRLVGKVAYQVIADPLGFPSSYVDLVP